MKTGLKRDEELMSLIIKGTGSQKRKAFDCLYKRYSQKLLEYFFFMLNKDNDKAQDFLQDLFLKLVEKPELFDVSKQFKSWMFTIASNMCKNEYRRLEVRAEYQKDYQETDYTSQPAWLEVEEDYKIIRQTINSLDSDHRSVITLRYRFDMSIKEIAQITGSPEGTVKSRLYYATQKLSKKFKAFDFEFFKN